MDDPTPDDLAIGVFMTIGGVAVVVIGAGWYPDLDPGTWAQWVGGLGTLLAVLVALFSDRIRGRMFGPTLAIEVSLEPPDCVRVPRVRNATGVARAAPTPPLRLRRPRGAHGVVVVDGSPTIGWGVGGN